MYVIQKELLSFITVVDKAIQGHFFFKLMSFTVGVITNSLEITLVKLQYLQSVPLSYIISFGVNVGTWTGWFL